MVDCCSSPGLLPLEQALEKMLNAITPITDVEDVNIADALDRVLAEDVASPLDVPSNDNSAMDGYAFAHQSLQKAIPLTLVGRSMAGAPYQGTCQVGQCIRIMTGAKVPDGCDTVMMQENCVEVDGSVEIKGQPAIGNSIRRQGEDIRCGEAVFKAGRVLSAVDVAVLASLGVPKVRVYRKAVVALISTGDELRKVGEPLNEGDIYESNGYAVANMLKKLNVTVIDFGTIADDITLISQAFEDADQQADMVISSGGVSVGDADYTKLVLERMGSVGFWKVAIKPGKPFAFGKLANSLFIGLPGNPVSAMVTADILAIPAIAKLQNSNRTSMPLMSATLTSNIRKSKGRMDFQRGVMSTTGEGDLTVCTTGQQGSGILTSIAKANCYIVLPAEHGSASVGDKVSIKLFEHYMC